MLDLPVGNVTVTVSDKTSRSARLPPDMVENLSEFFRSADRTATVYLGGQYRSLYLLESNPGSPGDTDIISALADPRGARGTNSFIFM